MRIASVRLNLFLFVLLLGAVGIQPVFGQAVITVDDASDDVTTNAACSIREAVQNANDDADTNADCAGVGVYSNADIINITVAAVSIDNGTDIDITDGVTINGLPTTITVTTNDSRHFAVDAGTDMVAFDGVSLTGGTEAAGNGGALLITSGTVDISNGSITDNTALNGGGIYSTGTLTIDATTLSGNEATGPAATDGGGGIYNAGGSLTITGATSAVSENDATGASGSGGGIFSTAGMVMITDATIDLNTANRAGGGIEVVDGTVNLTSVALGTTDNGNDADGEGNGPGNGGGLHVSGTAGVTVDGGSVVANTAASEGGGLWNQSGATMTVQNGTLIDNNTASGDASDNGGGGIFNNGGTLNLDGELAIVNVTNNLADGTSGSGGGIFSTAGTITIESVVIDGNTANRAGGGIEVIDGTINFNGVDLTNNDAGGAAPNPGNGGGLHVSGTAATNLTDMLVQNNMAASEGGGLWNQSGATMTLMPPVTVDNNTASGDAPDNGGGGIFNNGGTLNIDSMGGNISITNNDADGDSGSGGGIFSTAGMVTLTDITIDLNTANRAGGGIEVIDGTVNLTSVALGTTGNGNDADGGGNGPGNGGGLHVSGTAGVTVDGGSVVANTAALEGGGLWNQSGATMTVQNGTSIDGNTASGDGADDGGGGLFNNGGTLNITGAATTVTNNVADGTSGSGGGILNNGATAILNVTDATIQGNVANRAGGGIEDNGGTVNLTNAILTENNVGETPAVPAPGNGGGLHSGGGVVIVDGGEVTFNVAVEGGGLWTSNMLTVRNGTLIDGNEANGDAGDDGGGGIFNQGGTVTITGATTIISNNTATGTSGSGGGILNNTADATLNVTDATIQGNVANRAGGGIEDNGGIVNLTNAILTENNVGVAPAVPAPGNGGGLHSGGGTVTVDGGQVTSNVAVEGGGLWTSNMLTVQNGVLVDANEANGPAADNGGGGIFNSGGMVTITGATTVISNNTATGASGSGGGILNDTDGTLNVTDATISGNSSQRAGGGIEDNAGSMITLTNATLDGNTTGPAPGNGGGLHITGAGMLLMDGGSVINNVAAAEGGGLWNSAASTMTVQNGTLVDGNMANGTATDNGGGGIFNDGGSVTVTGATTMISNNNVPNGSGSGGGIFNNTGGTLNVTDATISGNSSQRAGGGIEDNAGDLITLMTVTLDGNTTGPSPGNGGGLHITGAGTVEIDMSTISNNSSANEGGGLWNSGAGTLTVTSSTVSGNESDDGGGIFNVSGGTTEVNFVTIADNEATTQGGGVTDAEGAFTFRNTIIGDNTAPAGPDCFGTLNSDRFNLIENPSDCSVAQTNNIIGQDPMLGPLSDNGGPTLTHALLSGSPAIDEGECSDSITTDQRGLPRPSPASGECDMGSVENQTQVDLAITKDDKDASVNQGGDILYTLSYENNGTGDAMDVVITDVVPANTTFNADASTGGWSCADGSAAGTTCSVNVGTLASGANGSVTFAVTVNNPVPPGITEITNTASIADDGGLGNDLNPDDNSDSETTPINQADLSLDKRTIHIVQEIDNINGVTTFTGTFLITVTNEGPNEATGVMVSEYFAAGVTSIEGIPSQGSYDAATGIWDVGSIDVDDSATLQVTLSVTINSNDNREAIVNIAEVTASDQIDPDSQPGDGAGDDIDGSGFVRDDLEIPNLVADLSLTQTVDDASPLNGDQVTFTLVVTNDGPNSTAGVEVTDLLPDGLAFSSAIFSDESDTYDPSTGVWDVGALVNGASDTLRVTVMTTATGNITNTAEITGNNLPDPDSAPGNNEDGEDDQVSTSLTVSAAAEKATDVEAAAGVPTAFELGANYPNPFNPQTTIPYAVPEAAHVSIAIYDLLGRQISVLVDGELAAGRYTVTWNAQSRPTGVYLVRLQAGSTVKTQRITLMK